MTERISGVTLVRHAVLTFAGSWAAPGTGYPSDVVNAANPDLVFEVPIDAPWSFGPIPPGAPTSPSYAQSVEIAVTNATAWINANPQQTFALGGYSQGAEAASRILAEIMTGSLQSARPNLIGGYTFGNPWRHTGHTFPGGTDPGGRGIAGTNLTAEQIPKDANGVDTWWDFANPGDLYTTTPNDTAGADITAVYKAAIQLGIDINAMVALIAGLTGSGQPGAAGPGPGDGSDRGRCGARGGDRPRGCLLRHQPADLAAHQLPERSGAFRTEFG